MTDRLTDGQTDICDSRVAFATENLIGKNIGATDMVPGISYELFTMDSKGFWKVNFKPKIVYLRTLLRVYQ